MSTVFLTGATGLIGAAIARQLVEKGHRVRGLVRNPASADAVAIRAEGVEMVQGDVSDFASVAAAMEGADSVVHSAAMLGGPTQSMEEGFAVNVRGTINVLSAAARAEISPVVQLSTTTFFDMWENSLTETSPLDLKTLNVDPYSITKRLAFVEGSARVSAGQDIRFVIPGGAFGPSPCVERAMTPPSFDYAMVAAIQGQFDMIVAMPIPWVYVDDVARISVGALERGLSGERYIAFGRVEDVGPMSMFLNRTCEIAGASHRVKDVPRERLDDPDIRERFGESWAKLGKTKFPDPWFDNSFTRKRLDFVPTAMDDGIEITVKWLRDNKLIET